MKIQLRHLLVWPVIGFVLTGFAQSQVTTDSTIRVPTLVIVGDCDECDSSLARVMHEKISDSKLVILPNSGHEAFEDQPKMWIESVRDFINQ
jgi:pimeloyl-ACP methyl ester carboxylesterase